MHRKPVNIDILESRVHLAGQHPLAINFTDEAAWTSQFSYTVSKAKEAGITAVRLWLGFDSYNARPNAWDSVPAFRDRDQGDGRQRQNLAPEVIRNAFKLAREGFSVNLVIQPEDGRPADTHSQLKAFIRHLMEATETQSSTIPLKDVIDMWEIGNEVDSGSYWATSASNKTAGIHEYVDDFLIPAADELHAGADDEKVISAGVSYNPADLKTILDRLQSKGRLDAIDFAGFHPYGIYDPSNPSYNEPKSRTQTAKSYADAVGKKLVATEWNVRGFGNTGSRNNEWAQAIDDIYKQVILPNYETAFYFAMVNNWSGRGGNTSARPGSLLKHDGSVSVTPNSSFSALEDYYNSPLSNSEPFFSTYKEWQYGTISGSLQSSSGTPASSRVYIDQNADGSFNDGEPTVFSDTSGNFSIKYSSRTLRPGNYTLRVDPASGWSLSSAPNSYFLTAQTRITGANFTLNGGNGTGGGDNGGGGTTTTGSISGFVFGDSNNNGVYETSDTVGAAKTVFIDINTNGILDAADPRTVSSSNGSYSFSNLAAGTYRVTRVFPSGYRMSNNTLGYLSITLTAGQALAGVNIGSTNHATAGGNNGGSTGGGGNTGSGTVGSIAGYTFNDNNGNGTKDTNDTFSSGKTIYIDTNNNGKLDSGEKSVLTDGSGNYKFANLAAGTYRVRRVMPSGYRLTTPSLGYHLITLNPGQVITGKTFGSKQI